MKLYEFNLLDINNQMETVNQQGIYLDNHITKDEEFNLYAINMFFVEVEYNNHLNKINNIKTFKSGHLLYTYSNIDGLLWSHTDIKYYKKTDAKVYYEIKRKYLSPKWVDADIETQIKELAHNIRSKYNNNLVRQSKYKNQLQLKFTG